MIPARFAVVFELRRRDDEPAYRMPVALERSAERTVGINAFCIISRAYRRPLVAAKVYVRGQREIRSVNRFARRREFGEICKLCGIRDDIRLVLRSAAAAETFRGSAVPLLLGSADRARAVFVNMFGRFMRRAADRANMIDVVFVVGMLEAANGACTAFVIMFALFTAHGALTCCRVVIVRGHGMTADDTSMRVFKVMFGMLVTANRTFPAIINMLANFSANST